MNVSSGISRAEPSVIFSPDTYGLKAQMVVPLDAGIIIAPVVAPPVAVWAR